MIKKFKKLTMPENLKPEQVGDVVHRLLDLIQDNIEVVLSPIARAPILDGNLVQSISLPAATDVYVNHGLGREYVGWFVSKPTSNAVVTESTTANKSPERHAILRSTITTTVDVWFF